MKDYLELVKPDQYQVFLFSSPCGLRLSFARHYWFVVNNKGSVHRWEVLYRPKLCPTSWGHLHVDRCGPFQGMLIRQTRPARWHARLEAVEEGSSLAERMVSFIERSPETYPYCTLYTMRGPNSNTFSAWILKHFPEFPGKLSFLAFGKHFDVQERPGTGL